MSNIHAGEGYVPAYQMSATPWVTSSQVTFGQTKQHDFSHVSRFIFIKNNSATSSVLSVAFTENGLKSTNANFFILSGTESFTAEIRTDRVFISGTAATSNYTLFAGLTYIPRDNFSVITGSSGFPSVG